MSGKKNSRRAGKSLDRLLSEWPYEPSSVSVRIVKGDDARDVIQMRVDMGILQLETTGRPDGERFDGGDTYYDHLLKESLESENGFELSEDQCAEADREFVQFYHRRICWLALREYRRAVNDADHTLAFMDFCSEHSPEEAWALTHEQYRPFVLFHRTQAAALAELEDSGPESAISEINRGLEQFETLFREHDAEEYYEDDELVARLKELRESLREEFEVGRTLSERLADAIAAEEYELAARLRDELARRSDGGR